MRIGKNLSRYCRKNVDGSAVHLKTTGGFLTECCMCFGLDALGGICIHDTENGFPSMFVAGDGLNRVSGMRSWKHLCD